MIRGAIEIANRSVVSGWLYCKHFSLNGELAHAFVGSQHVGSGRIDLFRQDIKDAGLGDGFSGFYFPIALLENEAPESVIVRLDECDMLLVQDSAAVLPRFG